MSTSDPYIGSSGAKPAKSHALDCFDIAGLYVRIISSSKERQNTVDPGSPCLPARPRNCLSMRRDSCKAVPTTCKPPRRITSCDSSLHKRAVSRSVCSAAKSIAISKGTLFFSFSSLISSSSSSLVFIPCASQPVSNNLCFFCSSRLIFSPAFSTDRTSISFAESIFIGPALSHAALAINLACSNAICAGVSDKFTVASDSETL